MTKSFDVLREMQQQRDRRKLCAKYRDEKAFKIENAQLKDRRSF